MSHTITYRPEIEMDIQHVFKTAMQRFPAAVTLVATRSHEGASGLTATAVCSLSADPPSLLICVNRSASAHDAILKSGIVGVSLLPQDDEAFADRFSKAKGSDRFQPEEKWTTLITGAPVYRNAAVAFDCRTTQVSPAYTHSVIFAEVVAIRVGEEGEQGCLMWHGKGFARLAAAQPMLKTAAPPA